MLMDMRDWKVISCITFIIPHRNCIDVELWRLSIECLQKEAQSKLNSYSSQSCSLSVSLYIVNYRFLNYNFNKQLAPYVCSSAVSSPSQH